MSKTAHTALFSIIILMWLLPAAFFIPDRVKTISHSQSYDATVVACHRTYKTRRSQGVSRGRRGGHSYAPIAVTEAGYKAVGTVYFPKRQHCESMVGRAVKVWVNTDAPNEARINSFMQFWFYPVVWLCAGLLSLTGVLQKSGLFTALFMGSAITLFTGAYYEINWLPYPDTAENVRGVSHDLVVKTCLNEALKEEQITNVNHLKQFICIDRGLVDLSALPPMPALEHMDITRNGITSLRPLSRFKNLRQLNIGGNHDISSLAGLEGLTELETLEARVLSLTDISALSALTQLKDLDISANNIMDITPVKDMNGLEIINLDGNKALQTMSALSDKAELNTVTLYRTQISDLSPLLSSPKLRRINIGSSPVSCEQVTLLKNQLNNLKRTPKTPECS
ncbi:MAG: DUF3592 domain-containing protein [Maricaulaceae bacterium]